MSESVEKKIGRGMATRRWTLLSSQTPLPDLSVRPLRFPVNTKAPKKIEQILPEAPADAADEPDDEGHIGCTPTPLVHLNSQCGSTGEEVMGLQTKVLAENLRLKALATRWKDAFQACQVELRVLPLLRKAAVKTALGRAWKEYNVTFDNFEVEVEQFKSEAEQERSTLLARLAKEVKSNQENEEKLKEKYEEIAAKNTIIEDREAQIQRLKTAMTKFQSSHHALEMKVAAIKEELKTARSSKGNTAGTNAPVTKESVEDQSSSDEAIAMKLHVKLNGPEATGCPEEHAEVKHTNKNGGWQTVGPNGKKAGPPNQPAGKLSSNEALEEKDDKENVTQKPNAGNQADKNKKKPTRSNDPKQGNPANVMSEVCEVPKVGNKSDQTNKTAESKLAEAKTDGGAGIARPLVRATWSYDHGKGVLAVKGEGGEVEIMMSFSKENNGVLIGNRMFAEGGIASARTFDLGGKTAFGKKVFKCFIYVGAKTYWLFSSFDLVRAQRLFWQRNGSGGRESLAPAGQYHALAGQRHAVAGQYQAPAGQYHAPAGQYHAPAGQHHAPAGQYHAPVGQYHAPAGQHLAPAGRSPSSTWATTHNTSGQVLLALEQLTTLVKSQLGNQHPHPSSTFHYQGSPPSPAYGQALGFPQQ